MKSRDIVCATASVGAGIVWPPLLIALLCGALFSVMWITDHLHLTLSRSVVGWFTLLLVAGFWVAQGLRAYEWVRARCSPVGKTGDKK